MIQVSCGQCGAVHSIEAASVPPGGKVIKCSSCGRLVRVSSSSKRPATPAATQPAATGATPRAAADVMLGPPGSVPPSAVPPSKPEPATSGAADSFELGFFAASDASAQDMSMDASGLELDLGASGPGQEAKLPAPVKPASAQDILDLPAPVSSPGLDAAELPAPVARGVPVAAVAPEYGAPGAPGGHDDDDIIDLPAPLASPGLELDDLPAPAGVSNDDIIDLPAPLAADSGFDDLPAPVGPASKDIIGLPAPASRPAAATPPPAERHQDLIDLPGPLDIGLGDDMPAPTGFFDDVPAPASGSQNALDVPAPSGFFDDIPAPTAANSGLDVPAPSGFFDDIPAPTAAAASDPGAQDQPMSLDLDGLDGLDGLDLDLPGAPPPAAEPPALVAPSPLDIGGSFDIGLGSPDSGSGATDFDTSSLDLGLPDLDAPALPPVDIGLDRAAPDAAPAGPAASAADFDTASLDFGLPEPGGDSMDLGLELAAAPARAGKSQDSRPEPDYDDLGLPGASAGKGGKGSTLKIEKPKKKTEKAAQAARLKKAMDGGNEEEALAIDEDVKREVQATKTAHTVARDVATEERVAGRERRKRVVIMAAVLGVALLVAGGFYGFTSWQDQKQRQASVAQGVNTARMNLLSDRAGHWQRAARAAEQALVADPGHGEALGLAAQAHYAAHLDQGTTATAAALSAGARHVLRIGETSAQGREVDKARALQAVAERRYKSAVDLLNGALDTASEPDADALLYLGWALAGADQHQKAAKAFADALAAARGKRQLPELYGLGQAQVQLGKLAEARDTFAKILELEPEHLGAQIGAIQAAEIAQLSEREKRYLAVLERDDLDSVDRRAVARAWRLAGMDALQAGRLDEARLRFEKAAEQSDGDVDAQLGLVKVALAQGRHGDAEEPLAALLKANPGHVGAELAAVELSFGKGDIDAAETRLAQLFAHEKQIASKRDRTEMYLLRGFVLEARAQGQDEAGLLAQALEAYEKASELAGGDDIRPAVARAEILTRQGKAEDAREVLRPVRAAAESDPGLAMTLGLVYAHAAAPVEAEQWFRKVLATRPGDVEARFQLGLALGAQGKTDESLALIAEAYQADRARADIGLELARAYEASGRDDEARALYEGLLGAGAPPLVLLQRAGSLYARLGQYERARELAEQILKEQRGDTTALYLRGEGMYHAGEYENALKSFREAARVEPTAMYLEAQGRAAEKLNYHDEALGAYTKAAELDPAMLAPRVGEARVRLVLRDFAVALGVLQKAESMAPRGTAGSAELYHYMGVAYHEQGELKDAVKHYERALRADAERAETHYLLGQAFFDLDKQRDAARALTRATRLADPGQPWLTQAYLNLGYAERSRNNRREAIAAWEQYLARDPGNSAEVAEVKRLLMRLKAQ